MVLQNRLDDMERRLVFLTNEIRDAEVAVGSKAST